MRCGVPDEPRNATAWSRNIGAIEGGEQHLERLDEHLAGGGTGTSRAFVISRVFDAPRDLVWKAHSELRA